MKEKISVYRGTLPQAVVRDFEFCGVYRVEVDVQGENIRPADFESQKTRDRVFYNIREKAINEAIARFENRGYRRDVPSRVELIPENVELIASLNVASERRYPTTKGHSVEAPSINLSVEAIGYQRRKK